MFPQVALCYVEGTFHAGCLKLDCCLSSKKLDPGLILEPSTNDYRKSSIKPPGANIILDTPEEGLLERGASGAYSEKVR